MKFYPESEIRQKADDPTIKMLDLWHKECESRIQADIAIKIADRRDHPQLKTWTVCSEPQSLTWWKTNYVW
jgi:hypothetical protein